MLPNAPSPWTWDEYSSWLKTKWAELLCTGDSSKEEPYLKFLEQHPCLIPGGEGSGDSFGGHHGGWNDTVISQPPLPGITKRIPDFMWLTKNSEDIIPVLIEIEAPGKAWFNKNEQRSAKLTQAQDQLAEWRLQLDNAASRQLLGEMYDFPRGWTLTYNLVPRVLLIYGRSEEFRLRPWAIDKPDQGHLGGGPIRGTDDRLPNLVCVLLHPPRAQGADSPQRYRQPGSSVDLETGDRSHRLGPSTTTLDP
jgi:Domain of unknown function (DUF4263)